MRQTLMALVSFGATFSLTFAQSERQLDSDACQLLTVADQQLNVVYQEVLKTQETNKEFVQAIKKAQRAWIAYRDAHMESVYPGSEDKKQTYGSAYRGCACAVEEELVKARITELQKWTGLREEGDVCLGSRMR